MDIEQNVWPESEEALIAYLREVREWVKHGEEPADGYSRAGEAAALIAEAAFNWYAKAEGITGFQAGWAVMRFVGVEQGFKGPFGILKSDDMLYPQYESPTAKARQWEAEWRASDWLRDEARRLILEHPRGKNVAARVWEHWHKLAGEPIPPQPTGEQGREGEGEG